MHGVPNLSTTLSACWLHTPGSGLSKHLSTEVGHGSLWLADRWVWWGAAQKDKQRQNLPCTGSSQQYHGWSWESWRAGTGTGIGPGPGDRISGSKYGLWWQAACDCMAQQIPFPLFLAVLPWAGDLLSLNFSFFSQKSGVTSLQGVLGRTTGG